MPESVVAISVPFYDHCAIFEKRTRRSYLVNIATQSSSQSWPMLSSDPDFKWSKEWAFCAVRDRDGCN